MLSQTLIKELGANELTPVDSLAGIWFKRDDLFAPFGVGSVNGGKLRQGAFLLAQAKEEGFNRVITGCSLISPQGPMIAAAAKHFGMDCIVLYGGTKEENLAKNHMPRLVKHFGAEIEIAKSGRANVLLHYARQIATKKDFIVQYGMNSKDPKHLEAFYDTTANQVQNLPDNLDNLFITCGSGITSAGVLYGLVKHGKQVNQVWLLGTAPNRKNKVIDRLATLAMNTGVKCWNIHFNYIDLYADGMTYEKRVEGVQYAGIKMHPTYEAKSFQWLLKNQENIGVKGKNNCFWIVGSEPTLLK